MSIVDETYDLNEPYFRNHSYIEWLESFTIDETMPDDRRPSYSCLLKQLWDTTYILKDGGVGNDMDRISDGLDLRIRYDNILKKAYDFESDVYLGSQSLFGQCRVLEVLVALAMNMYDIMLDTNIYNSVSRWFWEIMANVGFDAFDDESYSEKVSRFVQEKIDEIVSGSAIEDSPGGWFFTQNWDKQELWYQMHDYILRYF